MRIKTLILNGGSDGDGGAPAGGGDAGGAAAASSSDGGAASTAAAPAAASAAPEASAATPAAAPAATSVAPVADPATTDSSGAEPARWNGELTSLEQAAWYASLTPEAQSSVRSGWEALRTGIDRRATEKFEAAAARAREVDSKQTALDQQAATLQQERAEWQAARQADMTRIRDLLSKPPDGAEDAAQQVKVNDEVALQLTAAQAELVEAHQALEAAEQTQQVTKKEAAQFQQQLRESQARLLTLQAEREQAQTMLRQMQADRLAELIAEADPTIMDEDQEEAWAELQRQMSVHGDEPFSADDLKRAVTMVRAVYPAVKAVKPIPDAMDAMSDGGGQSPDRLSKGPEDFHDLFRKKVEAVHSRAR